MLKSLFDSTFWSRLTLTWNCSSWIYSVSFGEWVLQWYIYFSLPSMPSSSDVSVFSLLSKPVLLHLYLHYGSASVAPQTLQIVTGDGHHLSVWWSLAIKIMGRDSGLWNTMVHRLDHQSSWKNFVLMCHSFAIKVTITELLLSRTSLPDIFVSF